MIERALNRGIYATHVLMDKWFMSPKLIDQVKALGIDVIGTVKNAKTNYLYNGRLYRLSDLFEKSTRDYSNGTVFSSIRVKLPSGQAVKIVFVQNKNKRSEWLAILSSDTTLSSREIVKE